MTLIASVFPEPVRSLDVLKPITRGMHDAIGGFGIVVDEMIGEGDRVAVRWTMSGTQNGPLPLPDGSTLPPTGRSFAVTGMSFMRLDDGKLAEERTEADWMGFMQQLGATPGA
jgi:predicted ester cyclase